MRLRKVSQIKLLQASFENERKISCIVTFETVRLFGALLELIVAIKVIAIIAIDFYFVLCSCNSNSKPSLRNFYWRFYSARCVLANYYRTFVVISILYINFITILMFLFDRNQAKFGGYRLHQRFLIFLVMFGGWLFTWPLVITLKFNPWSNENSLFKRLLLAATFINITSPLIYWIYILD